MNQSSTVLNAAEGYLGQSAQLNQQILSAPDAMTRKELIDQKNELIENLESTFGFCNSRPEPAPDLPVFDLKAMDELITKEAQLAISTKSPTPKLDIKKTVGFSLALAMLMFTIGLMSIQFINYTKDLKPVISAAEEQKSEVESILASVGTSLDILETESIDELKEKLRLIRNAISAIASGATDEQLEELVNRRREEIKTRLIALSKQQNS